MAAARDARGQWTDASDRYTLVVYGNNLTNKSYITSLRYGTAGFGATWSKPASYGVEIGAKF